MEESTKNVLLSFEANHSDTTAPVQLAFDSPRDQSSYIKVIGVGGGGGNAVNNMYTQGIQGVDFIVCNTDMKALNNSPVSNKIVLGELGAGNVPEVARQAALDHAEDIKTSITNNTQMLFITAGMGGGTGTGAAPVIAEIAKQVELDDPMVKKILVVAIVTVPFSFEGKRRREQAEAGIAELRKHVDSILIINNDKLRAMGNLPLNEAFKQADNVLFTAVKGIAEIITVNANVNIDFHDVNTVMANSGTALMGAGMGRGENRAMDAIMTASSSVLLNDNNIAGAKDVLLYFSYSKDHQITMDELGYVTDYISDLTGNHESDVIWGAGTDDSLTDELKITLIATGFDQMPSNGVGHSQPANRVILKPEPQKVAISEPVNNVPDAPADDMHVVRHETITPEPVVAVEVETPTVAPSTQGHRYTIDEVQEKPQSQTNVAVVDCPINDNNDGIVMKTMAPKATLSAPTFADSTPHTITQVAAPAPQPIHEPVVVKTIQVERPFVPEQSVSVDISDKQTGIALGDQGLLSRADRIKLIHDMLRNDPNGPAKVEQLTPQQLSDDPIYETPLSSQTEASRATMDCNGNLKEQNTFVSDVPD